MPEISPDLKYPIGKFAARAALTGTEEITSAQLDGWLNEIAAAPAQLRAAVAGLYC